MVLPESVARRIAAGEVIERPASVVRELIDNSLDAGSRSVDVEYSGGGLERIRVRDTGWGMSAENLAVCHHTHATSKIRTLEDLDHTRTLGFRGEALSSIAAVAEVEICSRVADSNEGNRIVLRNGAVTQSGAGACAEGTQIEVRRLFADLPARRRFLSRPQAESSAIRRTVLEKATPFPDVRFTLSGEYGRKLTLSPASTLQRVAQAYGSSVHESALHEVTGTGDGFSVTIVAGHPDLFRHDRRLIQVFINRRRIWEYKLVQAVEYAYTDVLHGGLFPVAAVFLDVEPDRVDFNIHPAKREARLRMAGEIHHRIVELLRSFLHAYVVRAVTVNHELGFSLPGGQHGGGFPQERARIDRRGKAEPFFAAHESPAAGNRPAPLHGASLPDGALPPGGAVLPDTAALRYVGRLFETFLIVQNASRVYIIDQHAAHERIIYDRLRQSRTSQSLLVPEEFLTTDDQDYLLEKHADEYAALGIILERRSPRNWVLRAAPIEYRQTTGEMIETILELGGLADGWDRQFLAGIACKAAVKAGDTMDDSSALELAHTTLALPVPRCPHGRPLWVELDRTDLLKLIGRL